MKKNSILIVDDENFNLKYLNNILGEEYVIYTDTSGLGAIEKAKELKPDLILLDIIMPEMDGYQTLREIKKCEGIRNIPVIFITSLNSLEDEERGLDLDAADYIHKPFSDKIVKLRIRNQVNIINQFRELIEIQQKKEDQAKSAEIHNEKQTAANGVSNIQQIKTYNERLLPDAVESSAEKKSQPDKNEKLKNAKDNAAGGFLEKIRKIQDIDTEIGMTRSSGKEEVFQKILCIFQKKIAPECSNMTAFFYAGDIKNFSNSVHALKTLLATIGAMKLSKAALELEIATKKQDINNCTQRFHKFKKTLLSLDKKLSAILPET
ncbi:MAG: response regulator [Treponema sp.]|nr:response regulator [Treponema sp.]